MTVPFNPLPAAAQTAAIVNRAQAAHLAGHTDMRLQLEDGTTLSLAQQLASLGEALRRERVQSLNCLELEREGSLRRVEPILFASPPKRRVQTSCSGTFVGQTGLNGNPTKGKTNEGKERVRSGVVWPELCSPARESFESSETTTEAHVRTSLLGG